MASFGSSDDTVIRLDARHRLDHRTSERQAGLDISSANDLQVDARRQSANRISRTSQRERPPQSSPSRSSTLIHQLNAPAPLIRRAIQELESGLLDELLIHQLLGFDRDSTEFKREYVRLRVESLVRARALLNPTPATRPSSGPAEVKAAPGYVAPNLFETKSPWRVNRFRDLWAFFGPWLTAIFAIQLYAGHKLMMGFLANKDLFPDMLPPHFATLSIVGSALTGSTAFLLRLRGKDFHDFTPRLVGIGALSATFALAFHVVVDVI